MDPILSKFYSKEKRDRWYSTLLLQDSQGQRAKPCVQERDLHVATFHKACSDK